MYLKVEAVSNDIKVAYFSKIDFQGNLFNENSAHLLYVVCCVNVVVEICPYITMPIQNVYFSHWFK